MPHGTLDRWEAFDRVEPIGEHWKQTASIMSMITHVISYMAAYMGTKATPSEPEDLMPDRYKRPKKLKRTDEEPASPRCER